MPAQSTKGIDDLAREHAPDAIGVLVEEMQNAVESRDRIRAAEAVLDRGYGKPSQAIIQVPANRRQAALLAAMSDDSLVAVIEQKELPRLTKSPSSATITPANPRGLYASVEIDPLLA
jgi:translation initiation factor IF-2